MEKLNLVLRHYNKLKPINCTMISGDIKKLFTVQINDNENNGTEIIKGDPVLIGILSSDDSIQINGGIVIGATLDDDKYIIYSNDVVNIAQEFDKREYERYPATLLGDIKLMNANKRERACVKDISYSGMCIYSTGEYEVNDTIEITIYLSNNVSRFDGTVIRKAISYGRNEYGIQIIHRDKISMEATKAQLYNLLQSDKELMLRQLLNTKYKI